MGQKKRTVFEEEDDIDKILAEFSKMEVSATPPLEEKVEVRPQPSPKEESARTNRNRNRKRKEKQKEKKAAAAAEKQEMETEAEEPQKIKAPNKRLEFIRAEIDRRNHAIQKRLREKEEEQKRQEELDRQAEEAKLRKKEKEKKQKAKQREQQRQLESRRNQLQANAVKQYAEVEESVKANKKHLEQQKNVAKVDSVETVTVGRNFLLWKIIWKLLMPPRKLDRKKKKKIPMRNGMQRPWMILLLLSTIHLMMKRLILYR